MNIYSICPTFESEKFTVRLLRDEDRDDLLKVYSDKNGSCRGIGVLRTVDGRLDGLLAVGQAGCVMHNIPFVPVQFRLPEQPVHLFRILPGPECQGAAQGHVRLGLTPEPAFPLAVEQGHEILAVVGCLDLFHQFLIGHT